LVVSQVFPVPRRRQLVHGERGSDLVKVARHITSGGVDMRQHKIGDKLTYKIDGRTVEFMGYAEHDLDGAYVYPVFTSGREFYTSLKLLEVIA
jgi:hypothetical protein